VGLRALRDEGIFFDLVAKHGGSASRVVAKNAGLREKVFVEQMRLSSSAKRVTEEGGVERSAKPTRKTKPLVLKSGGTTIRKLSPDIVRIKDCPDAARHV